MATLFSETAVSEIDRKKKIDGQIVMWMLMFFNDMNCPCKFVSRNKAHTPGITIIVVQAGCQEFRNNLWISGRGR